MIRQQIQQRLEQMRVPEEIRERLIREGLLRAEEEQPEEASYTCGICGVIDWDLPDAMSLCDGTCGRRMCLDCRAPNDEEDEADSYYCQQCYAETEAEQ